MAHNGGYYQAQGQPVQQQPFQPAYQQPQNIYQQLGKPQPQPHLQRHPTYAVQQQQPLQPQGFQLTQPQYAQAPHPLQQAQTPYTLSQTPYSSPQTPYPLSQTPYSSPQTQYPSSQTQYIPAQTPFVQPQTQFSQPQAPFPQSQTPFTQPQSSYPVSQTPYAPAQTPYPQPQQLQYPIQQQAQAVYSPQNPTHVSTSPLTNHSPSMVPTTSSGTSWRASASRPPPVALSASLAQQARAQVQTIPQAQQTPQTPARRPLPQPSPGANTKSPVLPPANALQRAPTLASVNSSSGSSKPFPVQPIQTNVAPSSKTPSPTRSRPLPTPTASSKRATVDLGKLPHPASGSVPSLASTSNSAFPLVSSSNSTQATTNRSQSPTKAHLPMPPSLGQNKGMDSVGLSRTSSYAINSNPGSSNAPSVLPNRRTSPPRFQSQPNSEPSSPVKETPPATSWNKPSGSGNASATASSSARFSFTSSSSASTSTNPTTDINSTSAAPPKKFTPMWKRTIPEMPAPVWGYAAGMVSEPHPKPKPQPPAVQPPAPTAAPAKGKGKLKKKSGTSKAAASAPAPAAPVVVQHNYPVNTGYAKSNAPDQRYSSYQQQPQQQQQQPAQYGHSRAPAGFISSRSHSSQPEEDDNDEESEEEEDEEDEENVEEEEEDEEEDESDHRYVAAHRRQYSQGQGADRQRAPSRGRYEDEETPKKKKVLRPKEKVDPYTAYTDVSPIPRPRKARDDGYPVETASKIKIRPKIHDRTSDEEDRKPKKKILRDPFEGRKHERSKSAFEMVRHRREPGERDRRPESAFAGRRSRYEEEEEDVVRLAYDDPEDDEEESEVEWKNTPKISAVRNRDREQQGREKDWYRREERDSPQWGIRDLPMPKRRPASNAPYSSDDDDEEQEDYQHRRPATAAREREREREYRADSEPGRRYRGAGAGLPQPPAMVREIGGGLSEKKTQGGPRWKSAPLKHDDYDEPESPRKPANQNLHTKFSAMNLNGNGSRSDSRGSASSSCAAWPSDLPRLPRTPGSATTPGSVNNDAEGYFDNVRTQSSASQGSDFRSRQGQATNQRMSLNIDDPPPRATVVRTPSPGPSGYTLRRELPQPQGRPQSQAYPSSSSTAAEQLQRRQSLYSAPTEPMRQESDMASTRRPQSQMYATSSSRPIESPFGHGQGEHQRQLSHLGSHQHFPNQSNQFSFNAAHHQRQTPAPPPTVGIESPHPVGGRDKLADIPKLEEDSNDESDNERRRLPRMHARSNAPRIQIDSGVRAPSIPMINIEPSPPMNNGMPMISVDPPRISVNADRESSGSPRKQLREVDNGPAPRIQVYEMPGISVSAPDFEEHHGGPGINVSGPEDHHHHAAQHHNHNQHQHHGQAPQQQQRPPSQSQHSHSQFGQGGSGGQPRVGGGGLICGGCHGPIIGRIVSAMGARWHPACFKCTVCSALLEHVSSYEHDGRPYCHLDYHENFAPRCYSCKTAIIEEQFISLDDPALGKRTYHTQHFFCAECGDPFLDPSTALPTDSNGELALSGDGEFEGFTVYKGHPYCEACHVRLRLPKCKRCKRSIRDNDEAVEALGGKWCWGCFVCASCDKPFEDPSFFQRGDQPYCEHCFSIMLRNEV